MMSEKRWRREGSDHRESSGRSLQGFKEPDWLNHFAPHRAKSAATDEMADDVLFPTREEQACVHLCIEKSKGEAARVLGWPLKTVMATLRQPHVKLYAIEYRSIYVKELARVRNLSLNKVVVTRESILARLMEIAQMDPALTRGSTDGQVKALRILSEIHGFMKDDPLLGKTDEELEEIVKQGYLKGFGKKDTSIQ